MKEFFGRLFGKEQNPKVEELTEEQKRAMGKEISKILEDPAQVNVVDIGLGKKKGDENPEK